jgi:hypothetical protein
MNTLELVLAFLAESRQGDRTQGQKSVLKTAKSTVEVHSVWHDIYVATETGRCGLLYITPRACARATAKEQGTNAAMHKCYQNNITANKQNRDAQTCARGGSAVFEKSLLQNVSVRSITGNRTEKVVPFHY